MKTYTEFVNEALSRKDALKMAAAKAAMTTNESYITNNTVNNETNIMKEKIKELIKEGIERERIIRENKSSAPIMVSTNKGGDTHVSMYQVSLLQIILKQHKNYLIQL